MKRISLYIVLTFIIFLYVVNSAEALEVRIIGEKLSVHADQVPLQDILQRITDQGVVVRIDPALNPRISASFENRDMQKGLASILKSLNYLLIWKTVKAPPPGRLFRLAQLHIFRPGEKDRMQRFRRRSAFDVARNPKDGSFYVRGEILLKLGPGMRFAEFEKLLDKIRGTVLERNPITGIYRIRLPENADVPAIAELITKHPGIGKAEPNYAYSVSVPYTGVSPSGTDYPSAVLPPAGKAPIAVLDTGLSAGSGLDEFVLASLDATDPGEPISDNLGHGTQMSLIAAGVISPYGVQTEQGNALNPVIPIRAFDDNGVTSNFSMMQSIDFALKNGARVMSLSWSSETESGFLEESLNYADSQGLVIIAAAGNEPTGKEVWPAAYESVIGVGALAPDGTPWKKSNYGSFVTLSAPGFADLPVGYKGEPGLYAGTSISTAYVANRIASYLSENPEARKQDVVNALDDLF